MNPVIQLFYNLGCDLTQVPTNDYEAIVLVLKFIACLVLVCMFLTSLFKVMCNMLGGKW